MLRMYYILINSVYFENGLHLRSATILYQEFILCIILFLGHTASLFYVCSICCFWFRSFCFFHNYISLISQGFFFFLIVTSVIKLPSCHALHLLYIFLLLRLNDYVSGSWLHCHFSSLIAAVVDLPYSGLWAVD